MTYRPRPFGTFAAIVTASSFKLCILIDLFLKLLPQLIWNFIFVKQALVNTELVLEPRPHSYLAHMDTWPILG